MFQATVTVSEGDGRTLSCVDPYEGLDFSSSAPLLVAEVKREKIFGQLLQVSLDQNRVRPLHTGHSDVSTLQLLRRAFL